MTAEKGSDVPRGIKPEAIAGGTLLLVLGAGMLLQAQGLIDLDVHRLIAPLVLMALGALSLANAGTVGEVAGPRGAAERRRRPHQRRGVAGGIWLMGLGVWMLVSQLHLFGLDFHTSWPLLLVLSGLTMLIRGMR